MKKIVTLLIILLTLCGTLPLHAADWFRVEVVVFARDGSAAFSEERWPANPGMIEHGNARITEYADSPRGGWRLTGAKQRLESTGMTPLIHRAWAQPVYSRKNARSVPLRANSSIAPGVPRAEGLITVSVNRYLHVELDMVLRGKMGNTPLLPGEFQSYRFKQHRRMRSKELHYIDHPLMGVLIEILPLESRSGSDDQTEEDAAEAPTPEQPEAAKNQE
ncbi:MAG: peptidoglycan binding protein CsiV [Gammaproteobacteria bacterium]|nr:peptidoglycan binding protein CsiV [Gammaproteobacteria bacterium]